MSSYIKRNIEEVRNEIIEACRKSGRNPEDIILVAVSKTVGVSKMEEVLENGCAVFGENRVQAFREKHEHFGSRADIHIIGHLQTNKVKYVVGKAGLIHSVDSVRLLDEIQKKAEAAGVIQDVLIQVDISGEDSKFGLPVDELMDLIEHNEGNDSVKIKGLMTMAPFVDDPEEIRWVFRKLRDVFIDISKETFYNTVMEYTSMGMSGDFCIAIEEGADIVRVGSRIFRDTH